MTEDKLGAFDRIDGHPAVEFERILDAAVDVVWALLTTPEGLRRWLAPAHIDLRFGGDVNIDFGDDGVAGGEILDLVPHSVLEYRWRFTGEPDSVVRFELEIIDPGTTRLRLRHRMLPSDQAIGYGAGWHAHLDQLEAVAAGREPIESEGRFAQVLPRYTNAAH